MGNMGKLKGKNRALLYNTTGMVTATEKISRYFSGERISLSRSFCSASCTPPSGSTTLYPTSRMTFFMASRLT